MELDLQLYSVRTDLAVESKEMAQGLNNMPIPGVNEEVEESDGIKITRLAVSNDAGSQRIGRAIGNYVTLEIPGLRGGDTGLQQKCPKLSPASSKVLCHGSASAKTLPCSLSGSATGM